jgi:hypothetical protein
MENFFKLLNRIANTPAMLYLLVTLIGFIGISVYAGLKIGCLILGIWAFAFMIGYATKNSGL